MRFCPECATPLVRRIPELDDRERDVCEGCGAIHYSNPKIVTGCLVTAGARVLLARRAIEPRRGHWTLPAGFMENDETTAEGAARETWEEARADIEIEALYTIFNLPHINQVHMFFRGQLIGGRFEAGPESLDVALFDADEIPWDDLSFPVVRDTLRYWCEDRTRHVYPVRMGDIR
ncbi:MAG: NUDIX hydrolase, partial [Pseudomonadales bacterium]|nr:NUDIX hydrolase [Pseudomonadales bacterium]